MTENMNKTDMNKIDMNKIDGKQYAKMLMGGATLLAEHLEEINDLNVFPVPDGDTGTNMYKTIEGGISEISKKEQESIGAIAKCFAHGALLGARGNSGVILSQIFSGICEELSKHDIVDARILANAYKNGIKKSYSSVKNPTEGTILTVFRESTEYACANITEESTVEDFFKLHIEKAREALIKTKELLPVLAEADVVDSGGAGYLYIALGMYEVLTGKMQGELLKSINQECNTVDISAFTRDSILEFGYCTELMIRLTTAKVNPDTFDVNLLIDRLTMMGGESIVAYKENDVVKLHVHTFTPGEVFNIAQEYGEFLTVKVENMSLQHSSEEIKRQKNKKYYSVISVTQGEGMCALFKDMGADEIVAGGQSKNPSIEDFISSFDKCNSEHIIVLPNNKNVFLAAEQASKLYDKACVHIIPTRNLMQGYGALSVITPGITDIDALVNSIKRASDSVVGIEITQAVRDVTLNGREIKRGDYISISNGEITAVSQDAIDAVKGSLEANDMDDYEIITLFVGKNVSSQERVEITKELEEIYKDHEIIAYESGGEIYDYLIALE